MSWRKEDYPSFTADNRKQAQEAYDAVASLNTNKALTGTAYEYLVKLVAEVKRNYIFWNGVDTQCERCGERIKRNALIVRTRTHGVAILHTTCVDDDADTVLRVMQY